MTLNPDTKEVKIYVTLKRSSSSGGSNERDYEYEFWSDVLERVKEADSGDTIYGQGRAVRQHARPRFSRSSRAGRSR